jgi:hypothetical protein
MPKPKLVYNKTYNIKVDQLSFGVLPHYRIIDFFKDGRTSEILQSYITNYFKELRETNSCSSFDILDTKDLQKYEVKTLAKNPSVSLYASNMKGSGRKFDSKIHLKWLKSIDGIILIDNRYFPNFRFRLIPAKDLLLNNKTEAVKALSKNKVTELMNLKNGESVKKIFEKD